eukprot:6001014-Amphidinium_carterae.1
MTKRVGAGQIVWFQLAAWHLELLLGLAACWCHLSTRLAIDGVRTILRTPAMQRGRPYMVELASGCEALP